MCYSAAVQADYRRYVREFGVEISIEEFYKLFHKRLSDPRTIIPSAVEGAFLDDDPSPDKEISGLILLSRSQREVALRAEIEAQQKRLAEAQAKLQVKVTKKAQEDVRIAPRKIAAAEEKLEEMHRREPPGSNARIYAGQYVPVMISEGGRRVLKPMRYHCRPEGMALDFDERFPGCYNARRDSLTGFWRNQFGHTHGVVIASAFFENVKVHRYERRALAPGEREANAVLEFRPDPAEDLLLACIWSHWTAPGQPELLSFALITEGPPPEVALAGHDRCVVPIKRDHLDVWLNPDLNDMAAQHAILDGRHRPVYANRRIW